MILDEFRLDGQVAVVTGAGRGLGAVTAVAFAEVGADVVIGSRTHSELESVAEKIEAVGRRLGDPLDIAAAAVHLASPAASFLTGKMLEVDGGLIVPNLDLPIPDL
ncbi:SDR family oxidoreductase [Candidatus Mycolicibacterium alkanivorans]|uniref:Peroxisomal trans-2-enoyl-CoA reductase n=1 Tax=Candidatus Mycolicibacterium alkanivorans TaxID=2954114 RepID=A0ABS9YU45_9MYCO|nr:SDR family oxidoreductase [Candidatus Mycolicibacterium alkanivorans]MCI4674672.1 SDR family oxidoreductase [Candidatus Mycolicibacterium alkanivorans]